MYSTLYSYVYDGSYVCIFHVSETLKDSVLEPRGENNKRKNTEPKSLLPWELRSGRVNYIFFMKSTSESPRQQSDGFEGTITFNFRKNKYIASRNLSIVFVI